MRMMTGALLILAGSLLMATIEYLQKSAEFLNTTSDPVSKKWLWIYALVLSGIGWFFMFWGVWRDLSAARWRKHHRHKGDT